MRPLTPRAFDDSELEIIERVYEAAWAQVEARDPMRDKEKDEERGAALRKRIFNLARSGNVQFDTLYGRVLMTIPQKWTKS